MVGAMDDLFGVAKEHEPDLNERLGATSNRPLALQATISIVFGLAAFLAFCFLRPRWSSLYLARRKRTSAAALLPQLPRSFFGWIPVVWRITDDEVLASAGLDAFAFLHFFKMAMKYTAFVFFFAITVIYPVIRHFEDPKDDNDGKGKKKHENGTEDGELRRRAFGAEGYSGSKEEKNPPEFKLPGWETGNDYLWVYLIFVYLFTAFAVYLIIKETQFIIKVRQKYLSVKTSLADRTIRLSGIPEDLRTEEKLKETIENLEIGKVESVSICRNWTEIDDLMDERSTLLAGLEGAWTDYLGEKQSSRKMKRQYTGGNNGEHNENEEQAALLSGDDMDDGAHVMAINRPRPEKRLWYGFMNLQSRKVDAIDYYEEKLRRLDERIKNARKKDFDVTPLAFVTLDSAAACQMACQAIIDPQPMQLMANPSPSPSGIMWRSTYLSRKTRMLRAWSITVFIVILTFVWPFVLFPLVGILSLGNIEAVTPGLADFLKDHLNIAALISTGLPTLILAILNVSVPYFYEFLSYRQGMTSVADIETSLISKNFFFIFFNLFVVFTMLGTISELPRVWDTIGDHLRDLPKIAYTLSEGLRSTANFYMNYIVLQTFGLFPFRLLQFGSVALYPWYRFQAKTPRDYSQLTQPGTFTYGFFIPQTLFIFIICIVYSVMKYSERIQAFGLIYFALGSFIYKYQLLYSMDHRQFSTGRAWPMMCVRFLIGLVFFQLVVAGRLVINKALVRSVLVAPLTIATVWFTFWYRRTYEPLMNNIALRTLRDIHDQAEARMTESIMSGDLASADGIGNGDDQQRFRWPDSFASMTNGAGDAGAGHDADRAHSGRSRYVNPNLVKKLEEPWIPRTAERDAEINGDGARVPDLEDGVPGANAEDDDD